MQRAHRGQTFGDGLALAALLRADVAARAGCVDKADDRAVEFFGLPHQAQRLAIALGLRRAEAALDALFGGMALFDRNHRHRRSAEVGQAADDGWVVRVAAVAVQLKKAVEYIL